MLGVAQELSRGVGERRTRAHRAWERSAPRLLEGERSQSSAGRFVK